MDTSHSNIALQTLLFVYFTLFSVSIQYATLENTAEAFFPSPNAISFLNDCSVETGCIWYAKEQEGKTIIYYLALPLFKLVSRKRADLIS